MSLESIALEQQNLYSTDALEDSFTRLSDAHNKYDQFVNVYGVVVSFALPKKNSTRASHKNSITFSILDPSLNRPSQSVCVNWFMNDDKLDVQTGDIIRLHKMKVNKYNDYPQLVGNPDKSAMVIFRHNRNYASGIPESKETATEKPKQFGLKTFTVGGCLVAERFGVSFATAAQWSIISYFPNLKFTLGDVSVLNLFSSWAETMFSHASMADTHLPHSNLHTVLSHLHNRLHSAAYSALIPPVSPLFVNTRAAPLVNNRCDVVCMVVDSLSGADTVAPASLLLWDGSTNGMLQLPPAMLHRNEKIHSSLAAATEYSRCCSADEVTAVKQRLAQEALPVSTTTQYLGSGLIARASESGLNSTLAKFRPGMWVRIRNLHLDGVSFSGSGSSSGEMRDNSVYATIHPDTHICLLYPYFNDVASAVRNYHLRLINLFVASAHPAAAEAQQQQALIGGTLSKSTNPAVPLSVAAGSSTAPGGVKAAGVKRKTTTGPNGDPYTPLALILVKALPAKYCCWGRIVEWWPKEIHKFVVTTTITCPSSSSRGSSSAAGSGAGPHEVTKHRLVFGLRIVDDTAEADVLICDSEAEHFLGVTARDLLSDKDGAQERVREKLQSHATLGISTDFYLKAYSTLSNENGRNSSNSNNQSASDNRMEVRRLQVFNSQLM